MLSVKINKLPDFINICHDSGSNLLVVGDPGTGKSSVITGMAQDGWKVTMLTGSSTYEETVNGIPYNDITKQSIAGNNMSVYNVPTWLEEVATYKDKQILFIDEFNTADGQVLKTFLSILTERKVPTQPDTLRIPNNCVIVAAMNPANQNEGEELIRPLKSRFMTVNILSTFDDYKEYALSLDMDLPKEVRNGLLLQLDPTLWQKENEYHEINPRSFTNFLKTLASITDVKERERMCGNLSDAFLGFRLSYREVALDGTPKVEQKAKTKKTRFPSEQELRSMSDEALNGLYEQLVCMTGSVTAMKTATKIKAIQAERKINK